MEFYKIEAEEAAKRDGQPAAAAPQPNMRGT